MSTVEGGLIDKISGLTPRQIAMVEDFVDFLCDRQDDRVSLCAAWELTAPSFVKIWDNDDDAEYDKL